MSDCLLVHPADVNLADVKALAAKYGVDVMGSVYVPRGQAFLCDMTDPLAEWRPADPTATEGDEQSGGGL